MNDKKINANAAGHKRYLEEKAYRRMDKTYIEKERRERIATAAMQGLLANQAYFTYSDNDIATVAVKHTDALIAALEGGDD